MRRVYYFTVIVLILFCINISLAGNTGKIAGQVVDKSTGEPLIGVNVIVKGTSLGAGTDEDGIYYTNGNDSGWIRTENAVVKNVTGAGDSFVAGLGYGYINNLPIEDTVKFAISMSLITISHEETINPAMGYDLVKETIKKTNWIEKKL